MVAGKQAKQEGGKLASSECGRRKESPKISTRKDELHPLLLQLEETLSKSRLPSPGHHRANGIVRRATIAA